MCQNYYKIIDSNTGLIILHTSDIRSIFAYFEKIVEYNIYDYLIFKNHYEIKYSQVVNHRINKK